MRTKVYPDRRVDPYLVAGWQALGQLPKRGSAAVSWDQFDRLPRPHTRGQTWWANSSMSWSISSLLHFPIRTERTIFPHRKILAFLVWTTHVAIADHDRLDTVASEEFFDFVLHSELICRWIVIHRSRATSSVPREVRSSRFHKSVVCIIALRGPRDPAHDDRT